MNAVAELPVVEPATMDAHTLDLLGFDKVRALLATYAASSLGRDLALQIEPGLDARVIRDEMALTTEMVTALGLGQAPPFSGLHDVRLLARRAAIGTMLTAEQLIEVAESLNCTGAMYRYRMRLSEQLTRVIEMLSGIEDLGTVGKSIGGCIDGRGHVLDMASRDLAAVRQKLYDLDEKVKAEVRRLLRDPELRKVLSYPNATVHGDHYVLPVAANHRQKVQGVVHRMSGTGETVFIEPASIAHLGIERVGLKADEDREVKRVLRRLSGEVGRVAKPLCYALDVIAKLDLVTAKARYSRDFDMYPPDVNTEGRLWLRNARHPLLEAMFRNSELGTRNAESKPEDAPPDPGSELRTPHSALRTRKVVPIDVRLGIGFNLLIITGPNTGGKTVTLKTTGLLCLMAQCGMHLPAGEGSLVPVFKHVLADIGDEQSLEQSLSTFSSHVSRIASIFGTATSDSLVLLDELGAGTDPTEGAALGRAILDQLDAVGCRAIVTTHLGDLKTYAFNNERAENGAVEFDIETMRPTYRLHIGQFGMSNALKIARRLKLPKELLKRAHKYLKRRKGKTGDLARLQELREEAEKAKVAAMAAQHEADKQREDYERRAGALEREAAEKAALNETRSALKTGEVVRVSRFNSTGKVVRVDSKKQTVKVSVGLGEWEIPFEEIFPV
ncbi:recombination and dna strand exchange inhibitor protein : Mismatch repair ATPase (MutS family) OS=Singulisphaera acidiphila (strain ATCC BAA-1392 / DSM 18658 / VKM B-2454 / MOB10) GN=Sinac_2874 PE=3 SV=1: MutS_V [Gemmataceae bacterium]|nr:recombination and dna strand exchange inhibitor protein : Mismatch repair ATPase (MutS family) OS=Singulisphaera acidiphila (strain ATCC BAA-1392 / DSM 18658 / VKM B-2454 / MOB10) GN=Sinac_2874 PE=3 SV=1: MutS_V [Gemmataceae bacterium]VTT96894.1 recombination and dna strand exchange inhibitor protein : Mismatch repair ATPase (MutS family) OS=Singulisphaera acidiphila (strain ATCC BAA-1392 / DSM 18658 / VKM B-2454 / MOB10) GN=Sinac_2874 PE=3 SV=1: MutS_V [Gemmataceae bacterium]